MPQPSNRLDAGERAVAVGRDGRAWSLASDPTCCRRDVAWQMRPGGLTPLPHTVAPRTMIEGLDDGAWLPSNELCDIASSLREAGLPRSDARRACGP